MIFKFSLSLLLALLLLHIVVNLALLIYLANFKILSIMLTSNKHLVLLAVLAVVIISVPSDAPYIKAKGRPLNIAHRGLCSILPENTMEAF